MNGLSPFIKIQDLGQGLCLYCSDLGLGPRAQGWVLMITEIMKIFERIAIAGKIVGNIFKTFCIGRQSRKGNPCWRSVVRFM